MRTIGIDLAVTAPHKAIVMNAEGKFVTPLLSFHSRWHEIQQVVARAREGVEPDHPLQAVMEPTGMAWFIVAVPLSRLGVSPIYLVNGQKVHDPSTGSGQACAASTSATAPVTASPPACWPRCPS